MEEIKQKTISYHPDSEDDDLDVLVLLPSDLELSEINGDTEPTISEVNRNSGYIISEGNRKEGPNISEVNRNKDSTLSEVNRSKNSTLSEVHREGNPIVRKTNRYTFEKQSFRCFKCGESGHKKSECKNRRKYSTFQRQKRIANSRPRLWRSYKGSHM